MSERAQIIATIGPASDAPQTLAALIAAGMDVARINMSHGTHASNGASITRIQAAAKAAGKRIPIVLDLSGPRAAGDGEHHYDAARSEITKKDLEDLAFGIQHGVDYIAQSYVGSGTDVSMLRAAIRARKADLPIVAKIERKEAVDALDGILREADAVMVARGDLGNAVPIEDIPFIEKDVLTRARAAGKPAIVATQMLLSMTEHAEPTRAEVTDVEYAVLLGADAVMLSEETAVGKFPVESVRVMVRLAERAGGETSFVLTPLYTVRMKTLYLVGAVLVLTAVAIAGWMVFGTSTAQQDAQNATYTIEGNAVTLVAGRAESAAAPGSASKVVTQYFGNEAVGDVNGDGLADKVFLLTQTTGGSGTFYYVVAALKTATGYEGTNAVLLGDRIAPQTTETHDGSIVVNYADRKPGESMTAQPSVGKSLYVHVRGGVLEVDNAAALADTIRLTSPLADSTTTSPIRIKGEARGSWYFEASFPVLLTDWDGKIIAQGVATAQGDWMTNDFVPFTAELTYTPGDIAGYSNRGTLILKKDNPSGLPEHDNALEVPVLLQ